MSARRHLTDAFFYKSCAGCTECFGNDAGRRKENRQSATELAENHMCWRMFQPNNYSSNNNNPIPDSKQIQQPNLQANPINEPADQPANQQKL
jgi:hypothetical protein